MNLEISTSNWFIIKVTSDQLYKFLWWNNVIVMSLSRVNRWPFVLGVIHKGCPHKFGNFWDPLPLTRPVHIWLTTLPPPPSVRAGTRLAFFETLQLVNNSHWRVKKLIILFENNVKKIQMKTIFEMMSWHCVPYILYWIQAYWKFYLTNMVAIIFFQSGRPHLANHPSSPCPFLSTFAWPPSPLMCGHPLWMVPYG